MARLLDADPAGVPCPGPLRAAIPMAYSRFQWRSEEVRIEPLQFRAATNFTIASVVADRFAGKELPYTYTAAEARAIAEAGRTGAIVCGAEPPPPDFRPREGTGHFDHFAMNVLLQKAALAWIDRLEGELTVHCHDAHTATLPTMARSGLAREDRRFVVTAHNCGVAYRQRCPDLDFVSAVCDLPSGVVRRCVIEGEFDPFGAAALHADQVNTVSAGYAWEVQSAHLPTSGADPDVRGLSQFLADQGVTLFGIPNGIEPALKGPEAIEPEIRPGRLHLGTFLWKPRFRQAFAERISAAELAPEWGIRPDHRQGSLAGLAEDSCLFTFVGRWTPQKGVDILVRAAHEVLDAHPRAALCMLGDGNDASLSDSMARLVSEHPGRAVVLRGFSERLAAWIYAAGDFFVVPSRFEPCGLVDMIAQLNGNVPIVNQVGGLAKVVDGTTGLGYFARNDRENLRGLVGAMLRALALAADPSKLGRMRTAGNLAVRAKHNWQAALRRYLPLYGIEAGSEPPAIERG